MLYSENLNQEVISVWSGETAPGAGQWKVQLQKCSRASAAVIAALKRHVKKN